MNMSQGPSLIFDKSSLQSLNLDEAVLMDNFYMSTITPLFFVECLADLEKQTKSKSTPDNSLAPSPTALPATSTPRPTETPSGLPNTGGLPDGTSSSNWLLALLGFSILMVGFGFSLRVVGSPVEVEEEEDGKN